jgi:hypothetical protein
MTAGSLVAPDAPMLFADAADPFLSRLTAGKRSKVPRNIQH